MTEDTGNQFGIPFKPESIEDMKPRFAKIIREVITHETDLADNHASNAPDHWFDFDDGYRLNIAHDLTEDGHFIIVGGGFYDSRPWPIPLVIAHIVILFAALTEHAYGQGSVLEIEQGIAVLAYGCDETGASLEQTGDDANSRLARKDFFVTDEIIQ